MADENKTTTADSELKAPDWINTALVEKALQNSGEKNLKVERVSVELATKPGDNYGSTIYRVRAELADGGQSSFLVKGPPAGEFMNEATESMGMFKREGFMMAEVFPQIEALLEEAAPGKYPPFAARCSLYGAHPVEHLVLQDLVPAGFKMADRKRGLGLRHSLSALQCLARYHAGSHALLRRKPELREELPNPWLTMTNDSFVVFIEMGIQQAADACNSWPGFEEYGQLLQKFKSEAVDCFTKVSVPKPGSFTVIFHGDYWVNNMMFKYENGSTQPQEHRMLDFQGSTEASPALDLLYFFSTSVADDVSTHHQDLLLREYYNTLQETLRLLKLEVPSFETLLKDIDAHGPYSLMGTLNVIPIVKAQQAVDFEAGFGGDVGALSHLYDAPDVQRWMKRVLPEYRRRGWLPG